MSKYRILTSEDGSTVQMFSRNDWRDVVSFTTSDHFNHAKNWVKLHRILASN